MCEDYTTLNTPEKINLKHKMGDAIIIEWGFICWMKNISKNTKLSELALTVPVYVTRPVALQVFWDSR